MSNHVIRLIIKYKSNSNTKLLNDLLYATISISEDFDYHYDRYYVSNKDGYLINKHIYINNSGGIWRYKILLN
jgi:hypothetical protein